MKKFPRGHDDTVGFAGFRLSRLDAVILEILLDNGEKSMTQLDIGMRLHLHAPEVLKDCSLSSALQHLVERELIYKLGRYVDTETGTVMRAFYAPTPQCWDVAKTLLVDSENGDSGPPG